MPKMFKIRQYALRFPAQQRSDFDLITERFGLKAAWFTEVVFPLFQFLGPRAKQRWNGGLPGQQECITYNNDGNRDFLI